LLQKRRKHEQAPDAVDDAGDAGEQLDGDADRPAQTRRSVKKKSRPKARKAGIAPMVSERMVLPSTASTPIAAA
jgi:hypothetical protein